LLALFEIIDSGQVPQNAKRKVPYLSGSGGIHLNESTQSHSNGGTSVASSTASSVLPSPTTTKDSNNNHVDNMRLTTLDSNVSIEEPYDDQPHAEASGNEIVELIARCLRICGEEDGFLPLFKVVFAALADLEDNKYTHRLDGRGRDILLTGLITRMIRYVSEHVGLVFISDDVQCKSFNYPYLACTNIYIYCRG
jgi:hypothetical protein